MKRLALILTFLAPALFAAGQNNPYSIDDECYHWFTIAENSADDFTTGTFEEAQQKLLELSLRKKDTKAQTLYYVEQLRRTSRQAQTIRNRNLAEWDAQEWNARIDEDRETLQRIAKTTGYLQYYYYAADLCQTYYFNTGQDVIAGEMLMAMTKEARETNDEYGMWKSLTYLALLYKRIGDLYNTRVYLREAVRIYERTDNETITRQSMATQYNDLACTYPVGSDSARLFYNKAEHSSLTKQDTMKVAYYKAQLAAWDGDRAEYRRNRDYCLSQSNFTNVIIRGDYFFDCVDNMLDGRRTEAFRSSIDSIYGHQQYIFASNLAYHLGQWETASTVMSRYIFRLENDISILNQQRLSQMSAEYENNRLLADLADASQRQTRTTVWIAVLITLLLLVILLIARKHLKELRKAYATDEARLAELQNEKEKLKE
jgi:hypothetical protein